MWARCGVQPTDAICGDQTRPCSRESIFSSSYFFVFDSRGTVSEYHRCGDWQSDSAGERATFLARLLVVIVPISGHFFVIRFHAAREKYTARETFRAYHRFRRIVARIISNRHGRLRRNARVWRFTVTRLNRERRRPWRSIIVINAYKLRTIGKIGRTLPEPPLRNEIYSADILIRVRYRL